MVASSTTAADRQPRPPAVERNLIWRAAIELTDDIGSGNSSFINVVTPAPDLCPQ